MGKGAWPPASPWSTSDTWWDTDNQPHPFTLSVRFDSPVNGGGTNAIQGIDYVIDPGCPWRWMIIDRPDGARVALEMTADTGTFDAEALAGIGVEFFADIGSLTAGEIQG
jgi:hypothetical protein